MLGKTDERLSYADGLRKARSFVKPILGELQVRRSEGRVTTQSELLDLMRGCIESELDSKTPRPTLRSPNRIRCRFCNQVIVMVLGGNFRIFPHNAADENPYMCERCAKGLK